MVFVNGEHPVIILEFGEELLSNNSNICVIQSNRKWDQAAIDNLEAQIQLKQQVLYSHSTTSDVQTPTDDKTVPDEPTNDLPVTKECNSTCKFWTKPWTHNKCVDCKRNALVLYKGITDNWEAR